MRRKKRESKHFWYLIAVGLLILFLLLIVNSVLQIGDRLKKVSFYFFNLGHVFYVVAAILVYILIVRPIGIILFSPSFSVETTLDQPSRRNRLVYRKVARTLIEQDDIPDVMKEKLAQNIKNDFLLQETLTHTFNKHIKRSINKKIKQHAQTVMISTALIQNGRMDFFAVATVNLRMIKELVVMCGFRPSMKNLSKLTVNVMTTAIIAEGLENMNLSDVLPTSTMNAIGEIPLLKPFLSSALQGVSNALLTLRIGIVTRKYLFSDAKEITKEEIRRGALLEAAKMLPSVIGNGMVLFPKSVWHLFKKKTKEEEADLDE